jgi:hypothetical protein
LDEEINNEIASLIVNDIKDQLRLTLTNMQIRQISTIISGHNGSSKSDGACSTKVPIPRHIEKTLKDNSSESLTSSLTDASKVAKVPVESDNTAGYSSFAHYTGKSEERNKTTTNTPNGKFHDDEHVVPQSVSILDDQSSTIHMPPPPPTARNNQMTMNPTIAVVKKNQVKDQGDDVHGDKLSALKNKQCKELEARIENM